MYRFQHSDYLIGLGALPLLLAALFFLLEWKKKTATRMGDPALIRQLIRNFSPVRFLVKVFLVFLAFLIIILGAANPQKPGAMENIQRKGVDVMFVLDVSKSMLAADIKPSRLDKAKQLLLLLTERLDNDRLGLILFAGRAYLQMPLTTDHGAARMYIQDASPDAVPTQGTVIADALHMANTSFNSKERKYKSIVLISDGEDHDPDALKVAKELAQNGVMINTIGIGSPEGSTIIDPATGETKKDEQGNTVISKLNEVELQQLSDATNGEYIRLDNIDDALITMTQRIDSAEKKSMSDAEFIDYISFFQWFLGAAFVLLVIEFFLSERRREKRVAATNGNKPVAAGAPALAARSLLVLLAVIAAALPASAQSGNGDAKVRSGNRYYKKHQLDESVQQYQSAVQQDPDNPTANYNLGNAQFRKNNFDEAGRSYDSAIHHSQDKTMQEKGYYNKGVAMMKQKKLQESIEAWKKALKLDASDVEARDNLEKALKELKQQQQQQQQQQKNQKKDQNNKKEDKKDQDQQQQQQQEQPKPQRSRLNKQQVEQLLKALEQKENDLQNKMKQSKVKTPNQPEKDW